jgi:hypothetical protein
MEYFEVSAKKNINVSEAFRDLVNDIKYGTDRLAERMRY